MDMQGVLVTGSIARKTEKCISNLKEILEEAGSNIGKVVKTVVRKTEAPCSPSYKRSSWPSSPRVIAHLPRSNTID